MYILYVIPSCTCRYCNVCGLLIFQRLTIPSTCPGRFSKLMSECWLADPKVSDCSIKSDCSSESFTWGTPLLQRFRNFSWKSNEKVCFSSSDRNIWDPLWMVLWVVLLFWSKYSLPKFAILFLANWFIALLLFTYVGNSERTKKIVRAMIPLG